MASAAAGDRYSDAGGLAHADYLPTSCTIGSRSRSARALDPRSHDSSDIIAALRSESFPIGIKSDSQFKRQPHLNAPLPADSPLVLSSPFPSPHRPFLFLKTLTGWTSCPARGELTRLRNPLVRRRCIYVITRIWLAQPRQIRGALFHPKRRGGEREINPRCSRVVTGESAH